MRSAGHPLMLYLSPSPPPGDSHNSIQPPPRDAVGTNRHAAVAGSGSKRRLATGSRSDDDYGAVHFDLDATTHNTTQPRSPKIPSAAQRHTSVGDIGSSMPSHLPHVPDLTGRTVEVHLGAPLPDVIFIHDTLLTPDRKYLHGVLDPGKSKACRSTPANGRKVSTRPKLPLIELPDVDAEIFKTYYLRWLYTRVLEPSGDADQQFQDLTKAYVLGEQMQDLDFCCVVLHQIVLYHYRTKFPEVTGELPEMTPTSASGGIPYIHRALFKHLQGATGPGFTPTDDFNPAVKEARAEDACSFPCTRCGGTWKSQDDLDRHRETSLCGKKRKESFDLDEPSPNSFTIHTDSAVNNSAATSSVPKRARKSAIFAGRRIVKEFECPRCHLQYSTRQTARRHLNDNSCRECDYCIAQGMKCNDESPCKSCIKDGVSCVRPPPEVLAKMEPIRIAGVSTESAPAKSNAAEPENAPPKAEADDSSLSRKSKKNDTHFKQESLNVNSRVKRLRR